MTWLPFLIIGHLDLLASVAAGAPREVVVLALLAHPPVVRELEPELPRDFLRV